MSRRFRYRGSSTGLGDPGSVWVIGPNGRPALVSGGPSPYSQPYNFPWVPTNPGAPRPGSGAGWPGVPGNFVYSTDIDPNAEYQEAVDFFERPIPPEPAGPANQRTSYQTFLNPGVIPLPAIGAPDSVIVSFKVPSQWDGWITQVANSFNGPGFVPGSGDIVWRILQNGQAVRDFDNITVLLGIYSPGGGVAPLRLEDPGIPIYSDDTIQLVVSNVNTIAGASQVYGFLGGKRFPRGGGWGVSWYS